jgi:cysteinyl-tRNA synthetase
VPSLPLPQQRVGVPSVLAEHTLALSISVATKPTAFLSQRHRPPSALATVATTHDSYESRGGGGGDRDERRDERRVEVEAVTITNATLPDDNSNVNVDAVNILLENACKRAKDGQFDTADAIRDELRAHTVSSWDRENVATGASASGR